MTNLQDPTFYTLFRQVRQYYSTDSTLTMHQAIAGRKNVGVMDDLNYAIKTREYSCKISCYKTQLKVWGDNSMEGCTLVL